MPKKRAYDDEEEDRIADENVQNYSGEMEEEEEERACDSDEADEEEEERRRRKKKRKKKKRKDDFKIMGKSDQTEADRRVLRRKQRELNADLALGGVGGKREEEGEEEALGRARDANNALWGDVHYTREAVLDSENVDLIAGKAARQAEKLVQVPRYDAGKLAQALRKKGTPPGTAQFDWVGLGYQVGVCFNALPGKVSFLYGPLDAEYAPKERKKPERRKKQAEAESDPEEEEQPEDLDQTGKKKESDGNELSAVEQHIKVINRTLGDRAAAMKESAIEKAAEYETQLSQEIDDQRVLLKKKKKFIKENSQVDAVGCLFNPQSFTQTVENVFHFSFLVKQGHAGIKVRTNEEAAELGTEPGPMIRPTINEGAEQPPPKQAIVSLNMKDWRDMCAAYAVEESDVPHRVDGKVAKKEKKDRKRKSGH